MTRDVNAELDALYAELPTMACRGKCHAACNGVSLSYAEQARIAERGYELPIRAGNGATCTALTALGTCAVYSVRPMICRLWGTSSSLNCSYGCRPTRMLTSMEIASFLLRSFQLGGHPHFTEAQAEQTRRYVEGNPEAADMYEAYIRGRANPELTNAHNYLLGIYGV